MEPQSVFGAATGVGTSIQQSRQDTGPTAACARPWKAEKKQKTAPRGSLSLGKGSPHKGSAAYRGQGIVSRAALLSLSHGAVSDGLSASWPSRSTTTTNDGT